MKITREEPAPDREAWEKKAHETALAKGYEEAGPFEFRRGVTGAFHPDAWKHTVSVRWADGHGKYEAAAFGRSPATARFLEARLDEFQGKPVPGSGLTTLARAAAGGLLAWALATAVLFIFTIPLCRTAQREWAAKQILFELRLEILRAPIQQRILDAPIVPAAFIPAAALGFLAAIPLCLVFSLGELVPRLSRWNFPALITACIVLPMALISPGAAFSGLCAGILAPLVSWAAYAAIRAFAASGRAPEHGPRWAASIALVAVLGGAPAVVLSGNDLYLGARDRILFGTKTGEALATFYYRNTPLSAYALRHPDASARNTLLFAGASPMGFPLRQYRFLEQESSSKADFLRLARTDAFTLVVYNEESGPWVIEAAEELKRERPSQAVAFIGISKGGLEKVFPEASPDQFLSAELLRKGEGPSRVEKFNAALSAAYDHADRRRSLRDAAGLANSLAIFLGPVLLLGAWSVWAGAGVTWLKSRGLRRAAGAMAAAAVIAVLGAGWRVATAEGPLEKQLRETRAKFEILRAAVAADPKKQAEYESAAKRDIPDLKLLAVDPRVSVRVLAMDALGSTGAYEAYKILGDCVLNDPSILVRYRAADALGRDYSKNQRIAFLSNAQNDEIYVAEVALDAMLEHHP